MLYALIIYSKTTICVTYLYVQNTDVKYLSSTTFHFAIWQKQWFQKVVLSDGIIAFWFANAVTFSSTWPLAPKNAVACVLPNTSVSLSGEDIRA